MQVFGLLQNRRDVAERIADAVVEKRSFFAKDFENLL
jgi:hypothetical protein